MHSFEIENSQQPVMKGIVTWPSKHENEILLKTSLIALTISLITFNILGTAKLH